MTNLRDHIVSLRLDKPHPEYNEQGVLDHHPGYIAAKCQRCGAWYLMAGPELPRLCGAPGCQP